MFNIRKELKHDVIILKIVNSYNIEIWKLLSIILTMPIS